MAQFPIRRLWMVLGGRGLPAEGIKQQLEPPSYLIYSAFPLLLHPVPLPTGLVGYWSEIWKNAWRNEMGRSSLCLSSPPYHWLKQTIGRSLKQTATPSSVSHARRGSSLSKGRANDHRPFTQGQQLPSVSLCSLFSQEVRMSTWWQWGRLKCQGRNSSRKSRNRRTWKSTWWSPQHETSPVQRMLPVAVLTSNA